jgi:predicted GIY-YIG superfamily endonuclease
VFVEFHETMANAWKLELIERHNRQWHDLYEELA